MKVYGQQCRPDHPDTRLAITWWLGSESQGYEDMRDDLAVPRMDSTAIRVLTDDDDEFVCGYLRSSYNYDVEISASRTDGSRLSSVAFYAAGPYYFGVTVPAPSPNPNVVVMGMTMVEVFDDTLIRLGAFGY